MSWFLSKRQRALHEMDRRRHDASTYTTPLDTSVANNGQEMRAFLMDFYQNIAFKRRDEMTMILEQYPQSVGKFYHQLVTATGQVPREDFWQRYYYRCHDSEETIERVTRQLEAQDLAAKKKREERYQQTSQQLQTGLSHIMAYAKRGTALQEEVEKDEVIFAGKEFHEESQSEEWVSFKSNAFHQANQQLAKEELSKDSNPTKQPPIVVKNKPTIISKIEPQQQQQQPTPEVVPWPSDDNQVLDRNIDEMKKEDTDTNKNRRNNDNNNNNNKTTIMKKEETIPRRVKEHFGNNSPLRSNNNQDSNDHNHNMGHNLPTVNTTKNDIAKNPPTTDTPNQTAFSSSSSASDTVPKDTTSADTLDADSVALLANWKKKHDSPPRHGKSAETITETTTMARHPVAPVPSDNIQPSIPTIRPMQNNGPDIITDTTDAVDKTVAVPVKATNTTKSKATSKKNSDSIRQNAMNVISKIEQSTATAAKNVEPQKPAVVPEQKAEQPEMSFLSMAKSMITSQLEHVKDEAIINTDQKIHTTAIANANNKKPVEIKPSVTKTSAATVTSKTAQPAKPALSVEKENTTGALATAGSSFWNKMSNKPSASSIDKQDTATSNISENEQDQPGKIPTPPSSKASETKKSTTTQVKGPKTTTNNTASEPPQSSSLFAMAKNMMTKQQPSASAIQAKQQPPKKPVDKEPAKTTSTGTAAIAKTKAPQDALASQATPIENEKPVSVLQRAKNMMTSNPTASTKSRPDKTPGKATATDKAEAAENDNVISVAKTTSAKVTADSKTVVGWWANTKAKVSPMKPKPTKVVFSEETGEFVVPSSTGSDISSSESNLGTTLMTSKTAKSSMMNLWTILLSMLVVGVSVVAAAILNHEWRMTIGDALCAPVAPYTTLTVHSFSEANEKAFTAPWWAPTSAKHEAYASVCQNSFIQRSHTMLSIERQNQHYAHFRLSIVETGPLAKQRKPKALLTKKKLEQVSIQTDQLKFVAHGLDKHGVAPAPWSFRHGK